MPAGSGRGLEAPSDAVGWRTGGNPLQFLRNCDRACSDRHALRHAHTPRKRTLASPVQEEYRRGSDLFPCSDPNGYRAEPGPYSCRSRHDLHHACRTVRTL